MVDGGFRRSNTFQYNYTVLHAKTLIIVFIVNAHFGTRSENPDCSMLKKSMLSMPKSMAAFHLNCTKLIVSPVTQSN